MESTAQVKLIDFVRVASQIVGEVVDMLNSETAHKFYGQVQVGLREAVSLIMAFGSLAIALGAKARQQFDAWAVQYEVQETTPGAVYFNTPFVPVALLTAPPCEKEAEMVEEGHVFIMQPAREPEVEAVALEPVERVTVPEAVVTEPTPVQPTAKATAVKKAPSKRTTSKKAVTSSRKKA